MVGVGALDHAQTLTLSYSRLLSLSHQSVMRAGTFYEAREGEGSERHATT